jgi:hypothetical protein
MLLGKELRNYCLLKVALEAEGEDGDVEATLAGLVDEPLVEGDLVLSQLAPALVASLSLLLVPFILLLSFISVLLLNRLHVVHGLVHFVLGLLEVGGEAGPAS